MNRDILKQKIQVARRARDSGNKPSLGTMVTNAGTSVVKNLKSVAAGHHLNTTDEEKNKRMAICKGCEFFDELNNVCNKCGCYLSFKTWLKAEHCPIGKW